MIVLVDQVAGEVGVIKWGRGEAQIAEGGAAAKNAIKVGRDVASEGA